MGLMSVNALFLRSKSTSIYLARSISLQQIKISESYDWLTVGAQETWMKTFGSLKSIAVKSPLAINAVVFSEHLLSGLNSPK